MIKPDESTLSSKGLRRATIAPSYTVDSHLGSGCYLDAPGYPSHFVQHVWTRFGNSPRKGVESVIRINGALYVVAHSDDWTRGKTWDGVKALQDERLRNAWIPLPYESERVQIWIQHVYAHFAHCYTDPDMPDGSRADKSVIWPVPDFRFPSDPRKSHASYWPSLGRYAVWTDYNRSTQQALLRAYRASKKQILQDAWRVASNIENHSAVRWIRKFYSEHQANLDYIAHPPKVFQEDWIDIYPNRPDESECPGHLGTPHGKFDNCRMCGRLNIEVTR